MWSPDALRVKGAKKEFHQVMEATPTIWQNHCQIIQSETNAENHNIPGFIPAPREFLNGRQFQGARDFTYNVANNTYELSMIINRTHWEDDQTGLIMARIGEMAEVWATFKDSLFATLIAAGDASGSNGFTGSTFYSDQSIGDSGSFDNDYDENISATARMTKAEAQIAIGIARETFYSFNDDTGRPFNNVAINNMRAIVPVGHERGMVEAMSEGLVGGGDTNQFTSSIIQGVDVLPYLSVTTEIVFSALGSTRKGYIMQERTPLEIIILSDGDSVAENDGVMVLTRQRFRLTYGDPRRSILVTTT